MAPGLKKIFMISESSVQNFMLLSQNTELVYISCLNGSTIKAVNGSPFPVKGSVTLPLEVGSSTSKERFLIADIGQSFEVDGILGVDILRAHRGQIDLENERVRYDGTWISCVSTSSEVVAASDITIEPRHVSFIKVALPTGGYVICSTISSALAFSRSLSL